MIWGVRLMIDLRHCITPLLGKLINCLQAEILNLHGILEIWEWAWKRGYAIIVQPKN